MKNLRQIALAGAVCALSIGTASAATLTPIEAASLTSFTYSGYNVVNSPNDIKISGNVGETGGTYGAGQIQLTGTGANAGQVLNTWCIDAFDILQGSDTYTVVSSPFTNNGKVYSAVGLPEDIGATTLNAIGELVGYGDSHINASQDTSAAVQLAIWRVEYSDATFASLNNNNVNDLAGNLVAAAEAGTLGPAVALRELVDPGNNQGLAFQVSAVPLPASLPMFSAALLGLVGIGAKARRKIAA